MHTVDAILASALFITHIQIRGTTHLYCYINLLYKDEDMPSKSGLNCTSFGLVKVIM